MPWSADPPEMIDPAAHEDGPQSSAGSGPEDPTAVPLIIDGVLDLHTFSPRDIKDLIPDYIQECLEAGVLDLRIIHGKGIGVLREIVQGILKKHPAVERYGHPSDAGSWGATVVRLKQPVARERD